MKVSDFWKSRQLGLGSRLSTITLFTTPRPFSHTKGRASCRNAVNMPEEMKRILPVLQVTSRDILPRLPYNPLTAGSRQ
jgi:hypothetical protein